MRVQLFRFGGYQAGQTDFTTGGGGVPGNPIEELDDALKVIANGIAGSENVRSTITVAGHSDRQDRADFSCDQRRESEIVNSRDRAESAWDFCKSVITERLQQAESPEAEVEWWETSDRVTWDLVFAATGMLLNGSANEAERAQNRRVDILISIFQI
jgi:flagellar motor protein MotB